MIDYKAMQMVKNPDRKEMHLNYNEGVQSTEPECDPYDCDAFSDWAEDPSITWVNVTTEIDGTTIIPATIGEYEPNQAGITWGNLMQKVPTNTTDPADPVWCDVVEEVEPLCIRLAMGSGSSTPQLTRSGNSAEAWTVRGQKFKVNVRHFGGDTATWDFAAWCLGTDMRLTFNGSPIGDIIYPADGEDIDVWRYATLTTSLSFTPRDGSTSFINVAATLTCTGYGTITVPEFEFGFTNNTNIPNDSITFLRPDNNNSYCDIADMIVSTGTVITDGELYFDRKSPSYQVPDTCTIATRSSLVYNFEDDNYTWMDAAVADPVSPEPECQPYSCDAFSDWDGVQHVDIPALVTESNTVPPVILHYVTNQGGGSYGGGFGKVSSAEAEPVWCDVGVGGISPQFLRIQNPVSNQGVMTEDSGINGGSGAFTIKGRELTASVDSSSTVPGGGQVFSIGIRFLGPTMKLFIQGNNGGTRDVISGDEFTWRYAYYSVSFSYPIAPPINDVPQLYRDFSVTVYCDGYGTITNSGRIAGSIDANLYTPTVGYNSVKVDAIGNYADLGDVILSGGADYADGETYFQRKFPNYTPPSYCALGATYQVPCMQYGRDIGWSTKWDTPDLVGLTWDDFNNPLEPWSATRAPQWADMAREGQGQHMRWLTSNGYHKADQEVVTDNSKSYFVERTGIDLDDLVPEWTTNNWKHIRQFYFHLESELPDDFIGGNPFDITMGWSANLMDDPDWLPKSTINLQNTAVDGKVKWDFRSTGRYLAMRMDFDETQKLTMTGGDVDAEQSHGR